MYSVLARTAGSGRMYLFGIDETAKHQIVQGCGASQTSVDYGERERLRRAFSGKEGNHVA